MEIAEVTGVENLEVFLDGLSNSKRRDTMLLLAMRASSRVLPFALRDLPSISKGSVLSVFSSIAFAEAALAWDGNIIASARKASRSSFAAVSEIGRDPARIKAIEAIASALAAVSSDHRNVDSFRSVKRSLRKSEACLIENTRLKSLHFWALVRHDLSPGSTLIWPIERPPEVERALEDARLVLLEDELDWSFWLTWFSRLSFGKMTHTVKIAGILNRLDETDWKRGPKYVNPLFEGVLSLYDEEVDKIGLLANAVPVEFSFSDLLQVMQMMGIDDNTRHLRDPAVVQSFLDDAEQLSDGLQDFVDDAKDMQGGNFAGPLRRRAEKILGEFDRAKNDTHLRAERIVILANDLEVFAKDEKAATDLGATLKTILDSRLDGLKQLCRRHFGPSYAALAPLSELDFEQIDQEEVLRLFDEAIVWLDELRNGDHIPLDAEGIAVFHDMQRELHDYRAAIAEATTDEFRATLENRFAAQTGAMGLSIGRFYQRSAEAAGKIDTNSDKVIKGYKKAKTMKDIAAFIAALLGGPTP